MEGGFFSKFDSAPGDVQKNCSLSKNQKRLIILGSIIFLVVIIIVIINAASSSNEEEKKIELEAKSAVMKCILDKDLSFTEESHRSLSRKYASESMVLAQNNGDGLPLLKTDKVVLFGNGTDRTVYGGGGSGVVYKRGTTDEIEAVSVKQGMEEKFKSNKFYYEDNTKGRVIGSGLSETDIANFAKKTSSDMKRSVAVFTIRRRSAEGSDRPQDSSDTGKKLSQSEIDTYNSLIKYFDNVVVVLNVPSIMEIELLIGNAKTSILVSFLPGIEGVMLLLMFWWEMSTPQGNSPTLGPKK